MKTKTSKSERGDKILPIVAIGASAGGMQAISELLTNLPHNTGMAYIYIQHLDPTHESSLTPILQRCTKMKVSEVEDKVKIEADHLFIIPPDKSMTISDGVLKLSDRAPKPVKHSPIDYFFLSLAENKKETAVGIILSGAASDGAVGLKAIKAAGGLTFAQDETAEFQSMPKAAIAEGAVDAILSPKEIANELERLSRQKGLVRALIHDDEETDFDEEYDDEQKLYKEDIAPILQLLRTATSNDFTHYKENTIRRRIVRRMILNKFEKLTEYCDFLKSHTDEISLLYKDLLINVTHFFRDGDTVDYLKKHILPELIKGKSKINPLRIWVPACSTGEEAYSLAIIIMEVLGDDVARVPIQIFATDLSEHAIAKARIGVYSLGDLMHVSAKRLQKFFIKVDGHYRIIKSIRDLCVFAPHNVFKDPPFSRLDLITCCNLLIYLDTTLQKKILSNFHYALNKDGYVVLGKSETTGGSSALYTQLDKKAKVYQKRNDIAPQASFDAKYVLPEARKTDLKIAKKTEPIEVRNETNLDKVIDSLLLSQYVPPAVVITHDMDIVQFRGSTGMFLEPSPGKASLNLIKMARIGLAIEVRNAVGKVIKTGEPVKKSGIQITYQGNLHNVAFEISPLNIQSNEKLLLVVFEEMKQLSTEENKASQTKDRRVKQVEAELIALREDMRSIVEEQEAANEELQSANEEIVSSNEELQSINEELETSKEEVESSNEELMTINQELQVRNEQLAESQDYTSAIIATIREAVLVLDLNRRVKAANKSFYTTFNVKEQETEGKYIYELAKGQWDIPRLKELLEEKLVHQDNYHGFELTHTFGGIGEKVLLLNARKITQRIHRQQFILLAIEDITEHRQAEKLLEEREAWLRNMTDNVPVMIWVAGPDKNFTYLNKTWLAFTGRTLPKEIGIGWTEGVHKSDLENCISTYHASFEKKEPFRIEYRMKRYDGEYRWILNHAVPTYNSENEFTGYTGSCTEIHDQRVMNEELEKRVKERTVEVQSTNVHLERSNNELQQFAYVASHDLQEPLRKIITFSNKLKDKHVDSLQDSGKDFVEKISSSAKRMRQLIDDLLNFSRIRHIEKEFVKTDLNRIVKQTLTDLDLMVQEKKATIKVNNLPELHVVPLQISQLFFNILSNALKFTAPGKAAKIEVNCRPLPEDEKMFHERLDKSLSYVEIVFSDNGIGFDPEFAEQIFTIFQRLNDNESFSGTGIGLALCRKIVRNHNGEIFAKSKPGDGSAFYVILPVKKPSTLEE